MTWRRLFPLLLLTTSSTASAQPLWEVELRVGYGVALEGTNGETTPTEEPAALGTEPTMPTATEDTPAPLTFAALGAVAIREQPNMSAFGGLIIEHRYSTGVGVTGGVRVYPGDGKFRVAAGGIYLHAPETRWGASASAGYCPRIFPAMSLCGDLQVTTYFGGTEIDTGETLTQIQAVLGVAFDSL
jgi:hypothetical protein